MPSLQLTGFPKRGTVTRKFPADLVTQRAKALIVAACLVMLSSCGKNQAPSAADSTQQARAALNSLSMLYGEYLEAHQGRPPKTSEDFRKYLDSRQQRLQPGTSLNLAELLTSPRDGQEYVIICGSRRERSDSPGSAWAAYEQAGVDGKRLAVSVRGGVTELSASEFDRELSGQ